MFSCAATTGGLLSILFSPLIVLTGLCCFVSHKGRGALLVGGSCGALLGGIILTIAWFTLGQTYGTIDELADAIDMNDDSGITSPGWYFKDEFGAHECVGPEHTYQGSECTYETGIAGFISDALNSDGVDDALNQYVGGILYVALVYFGMFAIYLLVGAWCLGRPQFTVQQPKR
jgi:hypothetical protein